MTTLSDFYVGSRQLFGFVVPGLVWLSSIILVVTRADPISLMLDVSLLEVALFLAASLLVGTAIETVSFKVGVNLSAWLHRARVSNDPHQTDYLPSDVNPQLVQRVRRVIQDRYGDDAYVSELDDRQLSQFCRRFVLEKSNQLRRRVTEYEAEINLLAMLVLPLLVFVLAWTWNSWVALDNLDVLQRLTRWVAGVLAIFALEILLLARLHPLRREEAEAWYEMFLLIKLTEGDVQGSEKR